MRYISIPASEFIVAERQYLVRRVCARRSDQVIRVDAETG